MRSITFYLLAILLTGCTQYAYYQSPMHANTAIYKPIPLKKDSCSSAIYANGALTTGGTNENLRDGVKAFLGSLHKSHNFGMFQAYYGVSGALGRYRVERVYNSTNSYRNENLNDSLINGLSGNKFFGSYGAVGGINVVMPFRSGEWRIIGTEISLTNEFGRYLDFRNSLPDTAANIIERKKTLFAMSISTDLIFALPNGSVGYKMAGSVGTNTLRGFDKNRKPIAYSLGYFSHCLHYESHRYSGSLQLTTGSYALYLQAGISVRLNSRYRTME